MGTAFDSGSIALHRLVPREATSLAHGFIAGVTKPARPADQAETNPHQCDDPPRTAEQVTV
ncbi:MAG: hypothetical protein WCT12_19845 [Verrucomicrobiota bacterium]